MAISFSLLTPPRKLFQGIYDTFRAELAGFKGLAWALRYLLLPVCVAAPDQRQAFYVRTAASETVRAAGGDLRKSKAHSAVPEAQVVEQGVRLPVYVGGVGYAPALLNKAGYFVNTYGCG